MSGYVQRIWVDGVTGVAGEGGLPGAISSVLVAGGGGVRFRAVADRSDVLLRSRGGARRRARGGYPLGEIAALAQQNVYDLVVEAADPATAVAVVEASRRAGMLENLWLVSTELDTLRRVRSESPATRVLHACDPTRERHGAERHAATLRAEELEGVMVTEERVGIGPTTLMHRFGRMVAVSGVEYPRHLRRARAAGVDIVCGTDLAMFVSPG